MSDKKPPGVLDDGRPVYSILETPGAGWTISGPYMVIAGFKEHEAAARWLMDWFDMNARRLADQDAEAKIDQERLEMERREILARLLEPKTKQ